MNEKSKSGSITKIAILSISLLILGPQALSPAMGSLIGAFPDIPVSITRLLISLPLITLIIFTLITASLEKRFDKKRIVCAGITIYTVFGVLCAFANSFAALVIFRLIMGIGLGLTATYGVSFISLLFTGRERTRLIGLQSSATNVRSLILTTAAGILVASGWHNVFFIYLLGIPVLIMVIIFVPSFPPDQVKGDTPLKVKFTNKLWLGFAGTFAFFLLFFVVFSDFAIRVTSSGMGDGSKAGMGLTLLSGCALVISYFYRKISEALKRGTVPVGVLCAAVGFSVIGLAPTLTAANIGALIAGAGFGIIMPHCYSYASANMPQGPGQARAAAAITFATNIASFLSSYVLNAVLFVVGKTGARITSGRIFTVVGILFLIGVVVTAIICFGNKNEKNVKVHK